MWGKTLGARTRTNLNSLMMFSLGFKSPPYPLLPDNVFTSLFKPKDCIERTLARALDIENNHSKICAEKAEGKLEQLEMNFFSD